MTNQAGQTDEHGQRRGRERLENMTLTRLIEALTVLRAEHGNAPVHLAGGRPVRTVTIAEPAREARIARVLLHQAPKLYYRPWDGIVFRDRTVVGFLRELGEGYEAFANDGAGRLGDADTVQGALDLFDQAD